MYMQTKIMMICFVFGNEGATNGSCLTIVATKLLQGDSHYTDITPCNILGIDSEARLHLSFYSTIFSEGDMEEVL